MSDNWMSRATPVDQEPVQSDWMSRATPVSQDEATVAHYNEQQEKFGDVGHQAAAAAAGIARGATLGGSDLLLTKTGMVEPETLKGLEEANPISSGVGSLVGGAALIGATGGVGAALPAGAGVAARVGAMAGEGALFGAGNAVSDYALGDPELNAQKVMAHVGMGAVLGGGLGALGEAVSAFTPKALELGNALKGKLKRVEDIPTPQEGVVLDAPFEAKTGVQNTTLKDIQNRVKEAQYKGYSVELPQKAALEDALSRVELETPVNPLQADSLGSQQARDEYKTFLEMPGKEGDTLRGYEAIQKRELTDKIDSTISKISEGRAIEADAQKNGEIAADVFKRHYDAEKKLSGELVKQAKSYKSEGFDHLTGVVNSISEKVPQIGNMIRVEGEELSVLPYKTSMGVSKQTYSAVKEAVKSLKDNPQDFADLFAIRKGLDNGVNMFTADAATVGEIRSLKSAMMDYMQAMVDEKMPTLRDGFRRYAINEQKRSVIEKNFGISLDNPGFKGFEVGKPQENITNKIFSNTETVDAAKAILPKEDFRHILGNFIAQAKDEATSTEGVFSSKKFDNFLSKKQYVLEEAFSDAPHELQRLKDLALVSRILPDSSSINPSGTAKTLANYIKNSGGATDAALSFLKDKTYGKIEGYAQKAALSERLQGRAAEVSILGEIGKAVQKVNEKIQSGAKSIYSVGGAIGTVHVETASHFDKHAKKISELASNPEALLNHMEGTVDPVYSAAPNVSQGLNNSMVNAVNFLNSKLPKPNNDLPLSQGWEPSKSQKQKFNSYFHAVTEPLSALKAVKSGYLSNETMEALQVVHPMLLQEMQQAVMESMDVKKAKKLPYSVKISLSKFIGQPLDNALLPGVIAANQATFLMPSDSDINPTSMPRSNMGGLKAMDTSAFNTATSRDKNNP